MADAVQGISVVVDEPDQSVRVDPVTGTVEHDQPDGGVVVQLDAHRGGDEDKDDFYRNLAEKLDPQTLAKIANAVHDGVRADDDSRGNWLNTRARAMDYLGLELKEPSASGADSSAAVEGMSTVTNPLLLEACLKGWANAQAEMLPSNGPVKIDDEMAPRSEAEEELAEALERDMNHYLTVTDTAYYPDTSHMLLWGVYFGGSGFKKVYRDPLRRRPVSVAVDAKDLIVSDTTKDLRSCERITHQVSMRPSVFKRMKLSGAYRDVSTPQPTPDAPDAVQAAIAGIQGTQATPARPEDQPYTIWETQCEIDLDEFAPTQFRGKGLPLPYLITIDKESREVLALRRDWREDDKECERKRLYIRYPYVPGPGFYGTGLLNILGNSSAAMTAAWRLALDAAMFGNFPGGIADKAATRQNTSDLRVAAGTFAQVESGGKDLRTLFMPLPYKDVSPGMLALMDKVTQQAQSLGGVADIPTAEGVANVPVGTMLAQIEQATKVMGAAHKGMYQAQAEEIEMLVELFREDPEAFWRGNKKCPQDYWNEEKLLQALQDCDLVPRADPNTPSHIHRVARALGLTQMLQSPALAAVLNAKEVAMRVVRVLGENPEGLVVDPVPQAPQAQGKPTDPLVGQAKMMDATTKQKSAIDRSQLDAAELQIRQAELELKRQKIEAEKAIATSDLAKEMIIHRADAEREDRLASHKQGIEQQQAGLAATRDMHERSLGLAQHTHDRSMDIAQHGLEQQQHGLEQQRHALDVHTVLNPPEPKSTP